MIKTYMQAGNADALHSIQFKGSSTLVYSYTIHPMYLERDRVWRVESGSIQESWLIDMGQGLDGTSGFWLKLEYEEV